MAASAEAVGHDEGTPISKRQLVATLLAISFGTILECECCRVISFQHASLAKKQHHAELAADHTTPQNHTLYSFSEMLQGMITR